MKAICFLIFSILFLSAVNNSFSQSKTIFIENTSNINRSKEIVSIGWQQIKKSFPEIQINHFKVIDAKTNKEIAYQAEYKGEKEIQSLLLQISMLPKSTLSVKIIKAIPAKVPAKVYCRFVPERKDDLAWENDKCAYRVYGKALENFPNEMGLGNDVWVKRTDKLIINDRYKRNEYHIDHGDGLDYYHVGLTLGAGGIMPYFNDSICYSKNFRQWKVLDNGPLRCSFKLSFDEWNCSGKIISAEKIISLDAGSQLNKTEVIYNLKNDDSTLPVVVGIVKRKEAGIIFTNEQTGITGYWEPTDKIDGTTGVGCLFETSVDNTTINNEQILTKLTVKNHQRFIYYFGAAWNKAGIITSSQQWFDYLKKFQAIIQTPLIVSIK
ncbi:MAG TPA: DUF4861 family protein [Chitinophagaceae bacterium]|nr:DUF4861 family protein [Chitinophagaceae bacterium]